jgi:hypothetical protein
VIGSDRQLKDNLISKGFVIFLFMVSLVPLIGPAVALFIVLFLRFYPILPLRTESFQKINQDILIGIQKTIGDRTIPLTEALLIRQLKRDDALRMLAVIDEMEWTATKSGILRYIIRLSPFQNIVLIAVDMLKKKTDAIVKDISDLESMPEPGGNIYQQIANLYHEISYLDLCEPVMKQTYQDKACKHALLAYKNGGEQEDEALLAVKYLLEADRVDDAYEIYRQVRKKGAYFFPKWVTYEFEFAVRRSDDTLFNNLYLLIESGGGVFIPEKVKQAAKAWRKVLTSAWL